MVTKMLMVSFYLLLAQATVWSSSERCDFWDETDRLFGTATAGGDIVGDQTKRQYYHYARKEFSLDYGDKKTGDYSLLYTPVKAGNPDIVGFCSGPWRQGWNLEGNWSLHMWLKVEAETSVLDLEVRLWDANAKAAYAILKGFKSDGRWHETELLLNKFDAEPGFQSQSVSRCQIAGVAGCRKVWFDDVYFKDNATGKIVGVTDKEISQRIAEARESKSLRAAAAYKIATQAKNCNPLLKSYIELFQGDDIAKANAELQRHLMSDEAKKEVGNLFSTSMLLRLYCNYGSPATFSPKRLQAKTEEMILETIWRHTVEQNDIYCARMSTWHMQGSENHDLRIKACSLVSSWIFMNHPEYRKRVYPDRGFGDAYVYDRSGYFGDDVAEEHKIGGRANLADGTKYYARDHYEAWLKFLKEYFVERAKRGFFLERSSNGYMKHSLNFVDLIYMYGHDAQLKEIVRMFLDLVYADWAQEEISGIRGGPKTRHSGVGGYGSLSELATFYLGGCALADVWHYWQLCSDYELPEIVWFYALNREGLGCYEYASRGIGEEENQWPRPFGAEKTLLCDTVSRFLKYSYVTPDYILGTQMDHPAAAHSHLSISKRWEGMICGAAAAARIVPCAYEEKNGTCAYVSSDVHRSVQDKRVLITQQARRWFQINPDWFPAPPGMVEKPRAVYIGNNWDRVIEKDGWIFLQKTNALAAIRVIMSDRDYVNSFAEYPQFSTEAAISHDKAGLLKLQTDSYTWDGTRTFIKLKDIFSPAIIEAARLADYGQLEAFINDIMDNDIRIYRTFIKDYYVLVYTGCGDDAEQIVFNCGTNEIPMIGGRHIDYTPRKLFDSPYLQSEFDSGIIEMNYGGIKVKYDFENVRRYAASD